jgi:hypothetical protein
MEGAELEFTDGALRQIAKLAKERDTGARGLRSIVEEFMIDIMYELPDVETKGKFVITRRDRPPRKGDLRPHAPGAQVGLKSELAHAKAQRPQRRYKKNQYGSI